MTTVLERTDFRYDVFISYSSVDQPAAKALQRQLESLGRPFYRAQPVIKVFRDETAMSAHPSLLETITDALADSQYLLVLASPEAAGSKWVNLELDWWKGNRSASHVLLGYTAGEVAWDGDAMVSPLLPAAAKGLFSSEPRWVDLRFLREGSRRRDPRLPDRAAQFAAPVQDRDREEIYGEHLRRQRSLRRWRAGGIVALFTVIVLLSGITLYALRQRDAASQEAMAAQSRQLTVQAQSIADDQPELARQLLVQAWRLDSTGPVVGAVLQAPMLPRIIATEGPSWDVDFLPDGSAMIVTGRNLVTFYDPGSAEVIGKLDLAGSWATSAVVRADGKLLAVARRGGIDLFDIANPRSTSGVGSIDMGRDPQRLVFDRGGERLFALEPNGSVVVFDVRRPSTPKRAHRLPGAYAQNSAPMARSGVAVDPAGKMLLSQGSAGETKVWTIPAGGVPTERKGLAADGELIEFSPAGHLAATGADTDRLIRLWDLADPATPQLRAVVAGQNASALAFSADGKTLAVGTGDGTVQLYDVTDPLRVRAGALLAGQTDRIDALAFSPNGRTLATVHGTAPDVNGAVRIWRLTGTQRSAAVGQLPSGGLGAPAFSPDGRLLVDGFPGAVSDVTDPSRPDKRATLPTVAIGSHAAAFGPNGDTVVTSLPPVVWDITGEQPRRLSAGRGAERDSNVQILYQPGHDVVAVADTLGEAWLWDLSDPAKPRELGTLPGSKGQPQGMAFRPDGAMLASLGQDGQAQLWDVATPSIQPAGSIKIRSGAASVAWGVNAGLIYVGEEDGSISVWNVADPHHPRQKGTYKRHIGGVGGLAISPNGRLLASASDDGSVRLWESDTSGRLAEAAVLADGLPTVFPSLAFSPRGDLLAGQGQVWSVDDKAAVGLLCAESTVITPDQWNQYLPTRPYDPPCR